MTRVSLAAHCIVRQYPYESLMQEGPEGFFTQVLDDIRVLMRNQDAGWEGNYVDADRARNEPWERRADIQRHREALREAEARSRAFLIENLSDDQRRDYEQHAWFIVTGQVTGSKYRINSMRQMNVSVLDPGTLRSTGEYLCVVFKDVLIPLPDQMLMQKLMLECDENEFLSDAVPGKADRNAISVRVPVDDTLVRELTQRRNLELADLQQDYELQRARILDIYRNAINQVFQLGETMVASTNTAAQTAQTMNALAEAVNHGDDQVL